MAVVWHSHGTTAPLHLIISSSQHCIISSPRYLVIVSSRHPAPPQELKKANKSLGLELTRSRKDAKSDRCAPTRPGALPCQLHSPCLGVGFSGFSSLRWAFLPLPPCLSPRSPSASLGFPFGSRVLRDELELALRELHRRSAEAELAAARDAIEQVTLLHSGSCFFRCSARRGLGLLASFPHPAPLLPPLFFPLRSSLSQSSRRLTAVPSPDRPGSQ